VSRAQSSSSAGNGAFSPCIDGFGCCAIWFRAFDEGIRRIPILACLCPTGGRRCWYEAGLLGAELLLALLTEEGAVLCSCQQSHIPQDTVRDSPWGIGQRRDILGRFWHGQASIDRGLQRGGRLDYWLRHWLVVWCCKVARRCPRLGPQKAFIHRMRAGVVVRCERRVGNMKGSLSRACGSGLGESVARRPRLRLELVHGGL
jgi:hypothetical protein